MRHRPPVISSPPAGSCLTTHSPPAAMAVYDSARWSGIARLPMGLPSSCGSVCSRPLTRTRSTSATCAASWPLRTPAPTLTSAAAAAIRPRYAAARLETTLSKIHNVLFFGFFLEKASSGQVSLQKIYILPHLHSEETLTLYAHKLRNAFLERNLGVLQ